MVFSYLHFAIFPKFLLDYALATMFPCRIVGDPLQSIFGFGKNQLAEWDSQVLTSFKTIGELQTPWRWASTNKELGEWLKLIRAKLLAKQVIELSNLPKSIRWIDSADVDSQRSTYWALAKKKGETTCVIVAWERQCHSLARSTGGVFNSMETIECEDLFTWALKLEESNGLKRAQLVWDFAGLCCSGVKTVSKDIAKVLTGKGKNVGVIPKDVIDLLKAVAGEQSMATILPTLEAIRKMPKVKLFRGELYHEMCRTLKEHSLELGSPVQDSALAVRERTRQFGRRVPSRIVSRTLLIKGLEFDNCMIIGADSLDMNNLYVALTRASRTVTIVSKKPKLKPD